MADNVTLNSGSGGATLATDDIGGVQHQRVKIQHGADGSATDVSAASPLPVDGSGVTQPVSNTAIDNAHSADFDTGAGTDTTSAFGIAVPASGGAAVVPGDATAGLKVDLGADNDVTVSGTVTVDGSGVTQPVSGTVTANAGTGTFTVDGSAVTQPISGTVTADAGTGPWPVTDNSGSLTVDHTELDLLHTADFDSGAGTDTTPAIGIAVPASGGAAVVPGDATSGLKVDLGADNDVTVTGTVTVDGSGVTQPISAASLPLPTGAATAANQSTANTSLSNIETAVQIIDNAIFADDAAFTLGSSSVDVAGAIRDDSLTTLTAVEGDAVPLRVSATGALHVTGGGGGTEYVEDAAAPADPTGTVAVFVRDDAPVSHAADGDWVAQRGTQYGAGCVQIVTSTGSFVDSFGGSGGTSHADDAAFTIGSASSITPTGYLADETTPDSVDEGDVGVPRMTLARKPYAVISDPSAENSAGVDASGHLQVDIAADSIGGAGLKVDLGADNDVTVTGTVTVDTELPAAAALADAAANPTAPTVGSAGLGWNGASWDRLTSTTANGLDVDVTRVQGTVTVAAHDVTNAGTFAVQEDGAALTALQLLDDIVYTDDTSTHATGTSKGALIMAAATPTDTNVAANDIGAVAMTVDRYLQVQNRVEGQAHTIVGDASTTITGAPGNLVFNGTNWDRMRGDITNGVDVDVTRVPADPFGADADAASTTGSISAKLRSIATDVSAVTAGNELQVDVVAALPAGANLIGDVGVSGARTSGGTTLYKNIDVDESEDEVKGTAGQIYWIHAMNLSASTRFLKIYNATAATVVVGTTTPDLTFPIATQGDTNGAGFVLSIPNGIAFSTAITVAATTGVADADSGAPGANEVIVNLGYA